ncbi:MAG TPA: GtrA family protein [Candidatus Atribacteria bacterium]|nr:GtrA family protein [Atribacterota bacterium]HOA99006.1 GtrA family protein [Candidatus Atribacteria bacterium]MDI9607328.1 GtrA family protein [Atribacterota bacterium]HOQ50981.1 GtrA family protein [Candidatus Atribacteria bacterium]HPT63768.1 GtrA family protein [Candidatus Atribacteria bacterium]
MISYWKGLGQFIKFNVVGIMNTAVDFGVFMILNRYLGLIYAVSQVISYSCGMVNSYFLNKFWTFQKREGFTAIEVTKFILVNLCSLGVSLLVLYILQSKWSWEVLPSKVLATGFSVGVNFLGNKFWVFEATV